MARQASLLSIFVAGIVAGVVSALVQIGLWALFTDALPAILFRDARLTAAIALGPSVLRLADPFDARVLLVATVIHFALSIVFGAALFLLIGRCSTPRALAVGAGFGAGLYVLDLHLMTFIFPWFAVSRGAITFAAHLAFGMSAAAVLVRTCRSP
nr:hypothetical protein Hi04_10k_c5380_00013 [uncultured bacterium]